MRASQEWVVRALAESVLIVVSIVLALAVDEWRENRQNQELAQQSLEIFEREIRQNLSRIEDAAPYHAGLRDVIGGMSAREGAEADLRAAIEGLEPVVLLNTAWETALATGVLTHLEFASVSALSLTYSLQERFAEASRSGMPRFSGSGGGDLRAAEDQIEAAQTYLTTLARDEAELRTVYRQALEIIGSRLDSGADSASIASPASPQVSSP